MKEVEDAYGQINWAYFHRQECYEVIEREDGFIDVSGGPEVYFSGYRRWPSRERHGMRFVRGRVLDIGCGAGRHSLYLQKRGHDVTGIDSSPLAIKICKLRGLKAAKVLSITRVRFPPDSFDTILMLGANFGLFANPRRARWLLRRFARMTTPNARIIAESLDPYRTDDRFHLQYQAENRARGRMSGQVRIRVRWKKFQGPWFDYLFVSREEMRGILDRTGWHVARFLQTGGPAYIAILEKDVKRPTRAEPIRKRRPTSRRPRSSGAPRGRGATRGASLPRP